jgi:N-acyl-phosphatidylethanolamine-hydrolysing phospholipase D
MMYKIFITFLLFVLPSLSFADYVNTNGKAINKPLSDLLEWRSNKVEPVISIINISNNWQDISNTEKQYGIWIGHSTFYINNGNLDILTDPIFSKRASPIKFAGPKRLINTPLNVSDLKNVDVVTISHNHYDHLDIPSLKLIQKKFPEVIFLVPVGDKALLKKYKLKNIHELTWWETFTLKETKFTFTPTQHWSARGIFDRNESLWGGWYFETKNLKLFHAGDTGYSEDFKNIKNKLGKPDYAFIPIGAYDPEWFMAESHVTPEDAVRIMEDLGNPNSFGMHWGTFALTSEDTLEPLERLKTYTSLLGIKNFITLTPGDIFKLNN